MKSLCSKLFGVPVETIAISLTLASAHTSPQLIELCQAEPVCIIDNHCICVGYIKAWFNDSSAKQYIILVLRILQHNWFQSFCVHLTVSNGNTGIWYNFLKLRGKFINHLNSVVKEEYLTVTLHLVVNCVSDISLIVLPDVGFDWQPVHWSRIDNRHVFYAWQRHVKRSRDWSCRHTQNINVFSQHFEFFLVFYAKPVLLIDYQQAQILEHNIILQKPVCANNNVNFAFDKFFNRFFLLFGSSEARQKFYTNRKRLKTFWNCLPVLHSENCRRNNHSSLFAWHNSLEYSPDSYFRLAKPYIRTNQPVHRLWLLHIRLGLLNSTHLVRRFSVFKSFFHFALPHCIRLKSNPLGDFTLCIKP